VSGVISDYTTLQTSIGDWLARADLTSFIPSFIQNFEEDFYREPLNWGTWMEKALLGTVTNSVVALPSDYLGLAIAYVSGQNLPPLERTNRQQLLNRYARSGGVTGAYPKYIARDASNFIFGPIPSDGTVIAGTYYAKPALLRSSGGTWLLTNAPDLLLYGSLLHAEPFLKNDERLPLWQAMYSAGVETYRRMNRAENDSGSAPFAVAV
jgi:hypothetical protein